MAGRAPLATSRVTCSRTSLRPDHRSGSFWSALQRVDGRRRRRERAGGVVSDWAKINGIERAASAANRRNMLTLYSTIAIGGEPLPHTETERHQQYWYSIHQNRTRVAHRSSGRAGKTSQRYQSAGPYRHHQFHRLLRDLHGGEHAPEPGHRRRNRPAAQEARRTAHRASKATNRANGFCAITATSWCISSPPKAREYYSLERLWRDAKESLSRSRPARRPDLKVFLYYVGKPKDPHANAMAADYIKRAGPLCPVPNVAKSRPDRTDLWSKHPSARKILLDPAGRALDSAAFADLVRKGGNAGTRPGLRRGRA